MRAKTDFLEHWKESGQEGGGETEWVGLREGVDVWGEGERQSGLGSGRVWMCGSKRKQELALLVSVEKVLSWRGRELTVGDLRKDFTHRQTDTWTTATQKQPLYAFGTLPNEAKIYKNCSKFTFS